MSPLGGNRSWWRAGPWCAGLVLAACITPGGAAAQPPPAPVPSQAEPAPHQVSNVGGKWDLNWQESDKPPEEPEGREPGQGRRGGGGGRQPVGGGIGGIFSGGRMGGGTGPGGDGGRGRAEALEVMREFLAAPRTLVIVEQPGLVTLTDERGETQKLATNGVKVKETRGGRATERRTYWNGRTLVVETSPGGRLKVVQTYQKVAEGLQLVVTTKIDGGPSGQSIELKRIYDQSLE